MSSLDTDELSDLGLYRSTCIKVGLRNPGDLDGFGIWLEWGRWGDIQNFGGETSTKMSNLKTKKEMRW